MARKRSLIIRARVDRDTKRDVRRLAAKTIGGESEIVRRAVAEFVAKTENWIVQKTTPLPS